MDDLDLIKRIYLDIDFVTRMRQASLGGQEQGLRRVEETMRLAAARIAEGDGKPEHISAPLDRVVSGIAGHRSYRLLSAGLAQLGMLDAPPGVVFTSGQTLSLAVEPHLNPWPFDQNEVAKKEPADYVQIEFFHDIDDFPGETVAAVVGGLNFIHRCPEIRLNYDPSAPRPGNSQFSDDQIKLLPVLMRTATEAINDLLSSPIDDIDPKTATTQFWFDPRTGHGFDVVWEHGRWWREPNGANQEINRGIV